MKSLNATSARSASAADRKILFDGLTLIALGLSVLLLNSWDTLFVRTSVGLFWGTFLLTINWPSLVKAIKLLKKANDRQRHRRESAAQW